MGRSRVKVELFYLSLGFSVVCLLLIWYLVMRLRGTDTSKQVSTVLRAEPDSEGSQQSSSCVSVSNKQLPMLEKEAKVVGCASDKKIEEVKPKEEAKTNLGGRLPVRSVSIGVQTYHHRESQKIPHHVEMEEILKQELELQRQRNNILEEEVNLIKEDLVKIKAAKSKDHSQLNLQSHKPHKIEESDYLNVKNQLQFCQMKLAQSYLSEQQLKSKLDKYERSSVYLINHPEYQRLRQLNNRYKDIIISLQKHLLNRHGNPQEEDDLSFNDL